MNKLNHKINLAFVFTCLFFAVEPIVFAQEIGLPEISARVEKKFRFAEHLRAQRTAVESDYADQAALDNPTLSYGSGRLRYNGGQGNAGYDEFSVTQNISINGRKDRLSEQGQILEQVAEIDGILQALRLKSDALLAGIKFYVAKEQQAHIEERRKYFNLVSGFLKSRNFNSPQMQIEVGLIENKLDEIRSETIAVLSVVEASQKVLAGYIGDFRGDQISIDFLPPTRVKHISNRLIIKDPITIKKSLKSRQFFALAEKSAARQWVPDLQIYFSQSDEHFSGGNKNQIVGVGVELPVFNIGGAKHEAAVAQRVAAEIEHEIYKSQGQSQKYKLLQTIETGMNDLSIYDQKMLLKKEKTLQRFKKDFEKGLISAPSFLDFEEQVHTIHTHRLESQLRIYEGILGLIEMSGDPAILEELW